MKKSKLLRAAAITVLGLSLGAGVASAAPGDASIGNTGSDSFNKVEFDWNHDVDVDNDTDLRLNNDNDQHASSGDADVEDNTTGGDARTGNTSNDSSLTVDGSVNNSGVNAAALGGGNGSGDWSGDIDMTGSHSTNLIDFDSDVDVDVDNNTDLNIWNDNWQSAHSGDANVEDNTTGGSAVTGSASNTSTTSVTFSVTN